MTAKPSRYSVGIDVGGTFTDFSVVDTVTGALLALKVPSSAADPAAGIIEGLERMRDEQGVELSAIDRFVNGTTLALNTLIQRSGARCGLLVTAGFRDLLQLRRVRLVDAPSFYARNPVPLVPRELCEEIEERMRADGRELVPLSRTSVEAASDRLVDAGVEAVAVCFLHSYADPAHEIEAAQAVAERHPGLFVSTSASVWPEQREYERGLLATINAHVGRRSRAYFGSLEERARSLGITSRVFATASNGGVMTARAAAEVPVRTLMSGPAAGVTAAAHLAGLAGQRRIITFDMGGTSSDVSVVDGGLAISSETLVGDLPVIMPTVDVSSIGAGGGSIAWLDEAGVLKVGPASAGSEPGPACYGKGGSAPTVTDAYVVSGIIHPDEFLGHTLQLDRAAAEAALGDLGRRLGLTAEEVADAVIQVATANMYAQFLPLMARHGVDYRDFALVAYGGAGPTHGFLLAEEIGIETVLVPPSPGTLCALGCLIADVRTDFVHTVDLPLAAGVGRLESAFARLEMQARRWLEAEELTSEGITFERSADVRYEGQAFSVAVPLPAGGSQRAVAEAFTERYRALYDWVDEHAPIEIVNVRVQLIAPNAKPGMAPLAPSSAAPREGRRPVRHAGRVVEAEVRAREELVPGDRLDGPAILTQYDTTTFVTPGYSITVDVGGNLIGRARL